MSRVSRDNILNAVAIFATVVGGLLISYFQTKNDF